MSYYEVHLCPPKYPTHCFPGHCRHEPQFVMQADVHIVPHKRGGNLIEVDHAVCLACGATRPCTVGGNVLVDLQMLWHRFGFHPAIGARIIELREKWGRIATHLFDEKGWTGRHEKIARLIDPKLTMKLELRHIGRPPRRRRDTRSTVRMAIIKFDPAYLREAA